MKEAHPKGYGFEHAADERELNKDTGGSDGEFYRTLRPRNVPAAEDKWPFR